MNNSTVYGVKVYARSDSWKRVSSFDFFGKKFGKPEEAEAFIQKINIKKVYPAATRPEIVKSVILVIENFLTPECKVTELEPMSEYYGRHY